jgi:hypothetical protein
MKRNAALLAVLACLIAANTTNAVAQESGGRKRLPALSSDDVSASKDPFTFAPSGAITDFHITSDKGDPIGQGSTLSLKQDELSVTVTPDWPRPYKSTPINHVKLVVSGKGGKLFELWFSTEKMNKDLEPGTYEGAGHVSFAKYMQPGLAISGNGRGCIDARGTFSILQSEFHLESGKLIADSFAVEFEQHCGDRVASLRGHLYYNYIPPSGTSR